MRNKAKELVYENLDKVYAAQLIHYRDINESGSPIGEPYVTPYELFIKGEKEGTYVQLGYPHYYYYTVRNIHSDPTVVNPDSLYTLRELIEDFEAKRKANKEKEALINQEGFGKLRGQLNNLKTLLNMQKGRTR